MSEGREQLDYKATFDLTKIPEAGRDAVSSFLDFRTANRAYYELFPADRFDEGIGAGDSPRKELVHHIANTRIRTTALQTGALASWKYYETNPEDFAILTAMDKAQLTAGLDRSTQEFFDAASDGANLGRTIILPHGKSATGVEIIQGATGHENFHLGMMIKFGDYFGTPRPTEVKRIYG